MKFWKFEEKKIQLKFQIPGIRNACPEDLPSAVHGEEEVELPREGAGCKFVVGEEDIELLRPRRELCNKQAKRATKNSQDHEGKRDQQEKPMFGLTKSVWQTFQDSFSAVSKPIFLSFSHTSRP